MSPSEGGRSQSLRHDEDASSPVTTPGSVVDEEKFLVPIVDVRPTTAINHVKFAKWYLWDRAPFAILIVSLLEIAFYIFCTERMVKLLRFEPNNLLELWRFLTYMLLHDDWLHLILNVIMQLLFAYFLEKKQGHGNVLALYFMGGISGVLGASCVHPDLVIGASAGVYALLISHIADIIMNFECMKYKIYRCVCVMIIVISDVAFNCVHIVAKDEPLISWGAHVIGGLSGLFLGLVLYRSGEPDGMGKKRDKQAMLFWSGLILYLILMIFLVILAIQIRKCTPATVIRSNYVYFC